MGFVASTVACAVAPTLPALLVFRFFQGAFGSCGVTNAGASIADMVRPEQRGTYLAGVSAGTLIGPIIGPIIAGFLTEAKGWRWVFWLVTILSGVMAVPLLLLLVLDLGETYQPVLLQRKVNRLRKQTGNPNLRSKLDDGLLPADRLRHGIVRPVKLLIKSPISIVCALYLAVVYGYLYLMFSYVIRGHCFSATLRHHRGAFRSGFLGSRPRQPDRHDSDALVDRPGYQEAHRGRQQGKS